MAYRTDDGKRRAAFAGTLVCVLVWAVNYPAMKVAFRELSPLAYTGWRFVLAALLWTLLARLRGASLVPPKEARGLAVLLALSGVGIYQFFWAMGVAETTGFSAALLNATSPLMSFLLVALLGWERLTPLVTVGTLVAYGGVALFIASSHHGQSGTLRGDLLCLASAFCWAVYSVASSRVKGRIRPATAQAITFLWGTPLVLLYCAPSMLAQDYARVGALSWTILVASVVFPLILAFELWTRAIRTIGVTATTSLGLLIPIVAGVASALWVAERFPLSKVGGALIALAGLALTRVPWKARPPEEAFESPPEA